MDASVKNDTLAAIVERVERLNGERLSLASDVSGVYKEARQAGFNTNAIKELIRRRAKDPHDLKELDALVRAYEEMVPRVPAGEDDACAE